MYGAVASLLLLPPVVSPFFGQVLLCGFDGSDGATSAPDESVRAHTLSFVGNAQLDTAQSKFGGSSLLLDGTGDAVLVDNSPDFLFGDGEFTVEFFVRFNSISPNPYLIGVYDVFGERSWAIAKGAGGSGKWQFLASTGGFNGDSTPIDAAATTVTGQWYHIAVDRDASGVLRLYRDGVMLAKATYADALHPSIGKLSIGCNTSNGSANAGFHDGWLEEIRVTKGEALYGSDSGFTVPTSAYPRPGAPAVLLAETGTLSLAGNAATLKRSLVMPAANDAFALAGSAAVLLKGARLSVVNGTFTLTGVNAAFLRSLKMAAGSAAFTVTGNNAGLSTGHPDLVADAGAFTITGNAAALSRALRMAASAGSFSLAGNAAALHKALNLLAASGTFTLTRVGNAFKRALVMSAVKATFTLTGNAATLTYGGGATWQTVRNSSLSGNSTGWSGYTLRCFLDKSLYLVSGGTQIRVTFQPGSTAGFTIDNAFIGHGHPTNDDYDFETTPTRLTFSGANGVTTSAGVDVVSDGVAFVLDSAKDLVVSVHFSAASAVGGRSGSGLTERGYYKSGVSEAATVDVTSYTNSNQAYMVKKIEVLL